MMTMVKHTMGGGATGPALDRWMRNQQRNHPMQPLVAPIHPQAQGHGGPQGLQQLGVPDGEGAGAQGPFGGLALALMSKLVMMSNEQMRANGIRRKQR